MNTFNYQEIELGLEQSFSAEITENDVNHFRQISGDINPLHRDDNFAVTKGFDQKVVFGMLIASYYSTLAGVYIPGENCLLYQVDVKFKNPAFVNDKLKISGKVVEKSDAIQMLTIKAKITNEQGKTLSTASIKAGVLAEKN